MMRTAFLAAVLVATLCASAQRNGGAFGRGGGTSSSYSYYVDTVNGSDSNPGTQALPWGTYAHADAQSLTNGQSIAKRVNGVWIPYKTKTSTETGMVIEGYYQSNLSMPVSAIDWPTFTTVVHFAAGPQANGTLDTGIVTPAEASTLITAAHSSGVKVLLCISDGFGDTNFVSATGATYQSTFVSNIVAYVTQNGYDGVAIDWENTFTGSQYITFMPALYTALQAANPNLILQADALAINYTGGSGLPGGIQNLAPYYGSIASSLNRVNVDGYDLYLLSTNLTWLSGPIYDNGQRDGYGNEVYSLDRNVKALLAAGVPANKIVVGIPFFGYLISGNIGTSTTGPLYPRQTYSGGTPTETQVNYNALSTYYVPADENWDGSTYEPYLSIPNATPANNQYLTYDDAAAVTAKMNYASNLGLLGVQAFEVGFDYQTSGVAHPLSAAIYSAYPKTPLAAGSTPSTPTSLTASNVTANSQTISWTGGATATSYNVSRSTTSGSGYTLVGIPTGTSFNDSGLAASTNYYYVVQAVNNGTTSAESSQLTAPTGSGIVNILTNPNTINASPWSISGGTATGATTFTATSSPSLNNGFNQPTVAASTNYTASMTVAASGSGGTCGLNVYGTSYATTLGSSGNQFITSAQVLSFTFNTGSYTSVVFELDCASNVNGETITVTGSTLHQ